MAQFNRMDFHTDWIPYPVYTAEKSPNAVCKRCLPQPFADGADCGGVYGLGSYRLGAFLCCTALWVWHLLYAGGYISLAGL